MLIIIATTPTEKLLIRKSMSKLFQSFVYSKLPAIEHLGYQSKSGKVFKSMNFKIEYKHNKFLIYFTSLNKKYEEIIALEILQNGLKLGAVKLPSITLEVVQREVGEDVKELKVRGYVVAAIKNRVTGRKIYLQPGDPRHTELIKNHTLDKYETLLKEEYKDNLEITPTWQSRRENIFFYDKGKSIAWLANYTIKANNSMFNLILNTGLGAESMQNLGFVEVVN